MKTFNDFIKELDTVEKWDAHMADFASYIFIFEDDDVKFRLELYDNHTTLKGYKKETAGWFERYVLRNKYYLIQELDIHLPYHDYSPVFDLARQATDARNEAARNRTIEKNMKWLR